jgi:hypothetical protein
MIVGSLTIDPLLQSGAHGRLFKIISHTQSSNLISSADKTRLLSALLRAFRSLIVAAADELWGSQWGVCSLPVEVDIGLDEPTEGKGKKVDIEQRRESGLGCGSRRNGREAVGMLFEVSSGVHYILDYADVGQKDDLNTLLSLLVSSSNPQILLPIYQILSRLIVLPSHRDILARFVPSASSSGLASTLSGFGNPFPQQAAPSSSDYTNRSQLHQPPYILEHLLNTISPSSDSTRRNPKILQATLEVLAALVKGRPDLATMVRQWPESRISASFPQGAGIMEEETSGVVRELLQLLKTAPTAVRIAAASWYVALKFSILLRSLS